MVTADCISKFLAAHVAVVFMVAGAMAYIAVAFISSLPEPGHYGAAGGFYGIIYRTLQGVAPLLQKGASRGGFLLPPGADVHQENTTRLPDGTVTTSQASASVPAKEGTA